uniref:Uncharacterized protein n=1 Tax=Plectus sambesii TaxID=2011161 RepID=A0A914VVH8_9BILA
MNTPKLAVFVAFICIVIEWSRALECHYGTDRGKVPLRKFTFPPIYECCYKYARVKAPKFSIFGAVPAHLNKRTCSQVGECFYSKELHKNMCICANTDDPNCQSGPIKLSESNSSSNSWTNNQSNGSLINSSNISTNNSSNISSSNASNSSSIGSSSNLSNNLSSSSLIVSNNSSNSSSHSSSNTLSNSSSTTSSTTSSITSSTGSSSTVSSINSSDDSFSD